MRRHQHLLIGLLLIGCGGTEHSGLARPVIDTLPGGVVRVRNPGPSGWSDSSGFRLEEDLAITGTDGEVSELTNPSMLAVDKDGRIYVSDGVIKLFGADGSFIRTVGRDGAGPGEYRGALIATAGDLLLVQDADLARLTMFDSAGHYLRSWRTVCCTITPPSADSSGLVTVWISGDRPGQGSRYARYAMDGTPHDTLDLPESTPAMWDLKTGFGGWHHAVPFTPVRTQAFPPSGGIVLGDGTDYTIMQSGTGRDTTLIFSRAWTPTPISAQRREAEAKRYADFITKHRQNLGGVAQSDIDRLFRAEDLPSTAPAYTDLATDDRGTIWAKLDPGEDSLHSHFDLFTPRGVYLGAVRAPAVFRGYGETAWTSTAVYSIQESAEGTPVVKRYRIMRER